MTKVETEAALVIAEKENADLNKQLIEVNETLAAKEARIVDLVEKIDSFQVATDREDGAAGIVFTSVPKALEFLDYLKRLNNFFNVVTPEWFTDAILDFPEYREKQLIAEAEEKRIREEAYEAQRVENKRQLDTRKEQFDRLDAERRAKFHDNTL